MISESDLLEVGDDVIDRDGSDLSGVAVVEGSLGAVLDGRAFEVGKHGELLRVEAVVVDDPGGRGIVDDLVEEPAADGTAGRNGRLGEVRPRFHVVGAAGGVAVVVGEALAIDHGDRVGVELDIGIGRVADDDFDADPVEAAIGILDGLVGIDEVGRRDLNCFLAAGVVEDDGVAEVRAGAFRGWRCLWRGLREDRGGAAEEQHHHCQERQYVARSESSIDLHGNQYLREPIVTTGALLPAHRRFAIMTGNVRTG